jgi:hypothetical protein
MSFSIDPQYSVEPGSAGLLLRELLEAQRLAERATAYPLLRDCAARLVGRCRDLGWPLVWPVDEAADRLTGAATLLGEGKLRARGWGGNHAGDRVLLVAVAAVTPLPLIQAADHARALGVAEVHACGINVAGVTPEVGFDTYCELMRSEARTASALAA